MITAESLARANLDISTIPFKGKKYAMVVARVQAFRKICPAGCIDTSVVEINDEHVIMQAKVMDENGELLASGTAEEVKGSSQVNQTSYVENCETSAIGRALGVLGIGSEENMASADELAAALMNQVEYPEGKRFLGTYCSEHALSLPEICEKHNINRTAKKSDWYAVLAKVMAECGE